MGIFSLFRRRSRVVFFVCLHFFLGNELLFMLLSERATYTQIFSWFYSKSESMSKRERINGDCSHAFLPFFRLSVLLHISVYIAAAVIVVGKWNKFLLLSLCVTVKCEFYCDARSEFFFTRKIRARLYRKSVRCWK